MRILIIAPHHANLPHLPGTAAEAAEAANAHPGSKLLLGAVTERDIQSHIAQGGFDLLWFATHGAGEHIALSASLLDADHLVQLVRASGAHTVYINTCDSVQIGQRIVDNTSASVVCTIGATPDAEAMSTGLLFANLLASTGDPRDAYERSKPGKNEHYLFLANAKPAPKPKPKAKPKPAPKPDAAPRRPGGQPGNKNAVTHGFYAKQLRGEPDLVDLMAGGIENEIGMLRAKIRQVLELGQDLEDLGTATAHLDAMGNASIRLATLLRTQHLISPDRGNDITKAIGDALSAVVTEMQLC